MTNPDQDPCPGSGLIDYAHRWFEVGRLTVHRYDADAVAPLVCEVSDGVDAPLRAAVAQDVVVALAVTLIWAGVTTLGIPLRPNVSEACP